MFYKLLIVCVCWFRSTMVEYILLLLSKRFQYELNVLWTVEFRQIKTSLKTHVSSFWIGLMTHSLYHKSLVSVITISDSKNSNFFGILFFIS